MSIIGTLITNRTTADLARARELAEKVRTETATTKELAEWNSAKLRGWYNYTDLNRVTTAMEYLAGRLSDLGYANVYKAVEIAPGRTVWQEDDRADADKLQAYLGNAKALRRVFGTAAALPDNLRKITVADANHLEQMLVDVEATIARVIQSLPRWGSFGYRSGARPLPSSESDLGRTWAELDAMKTMWADWNTATWYTLLYGNMSEAGVLTSASYRKPDCESDQGRTWAELDAMQTTWTNWAATTWYALLYGDMTEEA
jgi:hypothetical protein